MKKRQLIFRRPKGRCWYARRFQSESRRWLPASTGITATEEMRRDAERVARRWRSEGEAEESDPINAQERHSRLDIREHFAKFLDALRNKPVEVTAQHLRETEARGLRVIEAAGWTRLHHITPDTFNAAIRKISDEASKRRRSKDGLLSNASKNRYRTAIKSFAKWASDTGRLPSDPLRGVRLARERGHRTFDRAALTKQQVGQLLFHVNAAGVREGMSGPERAMLYLLGITTGLRKGELASRAPWHFDFAGEVPTVRIDEADAKGGGGTIPVQARGDVLRTIAEYIGRRGREGSAKVFPFVPKHTARMLRDDLQAAGLPITFPDSKKVIHFAGLRTTCATLMSAAGAPQDATQNQMRHQNSDLTGEFYKKRTLAQNYEAGSDILSDLSTRPCCADLRAPANACERGMASRGETTEANEESQPMASTETCERPRALASAADGIGAKRPERDLNPRITDLQSGPSENGTDLQSVAGAPLASLGEVGGATLSTRPLHDSAEASGDPLLAAAFARMRDEGVDLADVGDAADAAHRRGSEALAGLAAETTGGGE